MYNYTYVYFIFSGTHPSVSDGIVPALGCVVESSEDCCGTQLNLAIKNCSANFIVYHLVPPNTCSIGYCAGHRLPCPEGLTSPSGFTPCECKEICWVFLHITYIHNHICISNYLNYTLLFKIGDS